MRIEEIIDALARRSVEKGMSSTDALKFTQAALNLAHVLATKDGIEILGKLK